MKNLYYSIKSKQEYTYSGCISNLKECQCTGLERFHFVISNVNIEQGYWDFYNKALKERMILNSFALSDFHNKKKFSYFY